MQGGFSFCLLTIIRRLFCRVTKNRYSIKTATALERSFNQILYKRPSSLAFSTPWGNNSKRNPHKTHKNVLFFRPLSRNVWSKSRLQTNLDNDSFWCHRQIWHKLVWNIQMRTRNYQWTIISNTFTKTTSKRVMIVAFLHIECCILLIVT